MIVPVVPELLSVDRISGPTAILRWIPLTQDQASGILTQLRIAYQLTETSECSHFNVNEGDIMYLKGNLFVQSQVTLNNLKPDEEYCVAIEVSTVAGSSGFSKPLKIKCEFNFIPSRNVMINHYYSAC